MSMNRIDQTGVMRQGALNRFGETGRRDPASAAEAAGGGPAGSERVTDRAEISEAARRLMEVRDALEIGRAAAAGIEDVRGERVAEVRDRLARGYYGSAEVRDKVAAGVDRVLSAMDRL